MRRSSPQKTDDQRIIALAASGDREAFGQLYQRYAVRVYRHTHFLTGDPHLAEDLTAQTFLKALEAIPRYEYRGVPFLAWLLRIAHNLTVNHCKAPKNNGHTQLPDSIESDDDRSSPELSCLSKIDGQIVWRQVRRLTEDQRRVIVMRFLDGLSYADVAHVLGKSVGAVRVTQFRALAALRHIMEESDGRRHVGSRAV
jgi:RNA polymerase sigma-70 factor (ECF subfamily)